MKGKEMSWAMVLVSVGVIMVPISVGASLLENGAPFGEPHLGMMKVFVSVALIGVLVKILGWPKFLARP